MNAYQRAVRDITDRRRADLDDGLAVWQAALDSDEGLKAAYIAYQTEAIKKAQGKQNELIKAKTELGVNLKRVGLDRTQIEPPVRCKLCNDTGYANGRYCQCVIKRVINSDKANLVLPLIDFEQAKSTAPKAISKVYAAAQKYIADFPDGKTFFIVSGSPGTGKTMLAAAIATAFMKNGASAVTVSAFEFLKRAKDYHTQFAIDDYRDLFTPMLDCDILCIDDLGTETMLKNITREYFYTVINERWLRRKNTVITTNLNHSMLLERYGETVFSRLYDKNCSESYVITAANSRIK